MVIYILKISVNSVLWTYSEKEMEYVLNFREILQYANNLIYLKFV